MSFKSASEHAESIELDQESPYEFDIIAYSNDNLDRIAELIRKKGAVIPGTSLIQRI